MVYTVVGYITASVLGALVGVVALRARADVDLEDWRLQAVAVVFAAAPVSWITFRWVVTHYYSPNEESPDAEAPDAEPAKNARSRTASGG